jgi:hypothetical protein
MQRLRYAALGAALAYFFDPQNGRARRKDAIKRVAKLRSGRQPELVDELVGQAQTAPQPPAEEPAQAPQ